LWPTHAKNRTETPARAGHADRRRTAQPQKITKSDQKRPTTALSKFLLEKDQSRLTDLALNKTPPEPSNTRLQQEKQQKKEKTPTNLHRFKHREEQDSNSQMA